MRRRQFTGFVYPPTGMCVHTSKLLPLWRYRLFAEDTQINGSHPPRNADAYASVSAHAHTDTHIHKHMRTHTHTQSSLMHSVIQDKRGYLHVDWEWVIVVGGEREEGGGGIEQQDIGRLSGLFVTVHNWGRIGMHQTKPRPDPDKFKGSKPYLRV